MHSLLFHFTLNFKVRIGYKVNSFFFYHFISNEVIRWMLCSQKKIVDIDLQCTNGNVWSLGNIFSYAWGLHMQLSVIHVQTLS